MEDLRNVAINKTDLSDELCKQAANYLFVAEKSIEAEEAYERQKLTLKEFEAQLDAEIRAKALAEGKKLTETSIENEILRNADRGAMAVKLIQLGAIKDRIRAIREAWHMRKDLLIQLAIKERAEIEGLNDVVKERKAA